MTLELFFLSSLLLVLMVMAQFGQLEMNSPPNV
jgi:hypothetical protein